MIVTSFKNDEEIYDIIKNIDNITIVGCNICAKDCQTSDENAINKYKEIIKSCNKTLVDVINIDGVCNSLKDTIAKREHKETLSKTDYFLVLSCGSGVQTIRKNWQKKVIPALNTDFLASVERGGLFEKKCIMCGECVLFYTGGICPKTACIKGLKNGACGGCFDGKCEISNDRPCAWASIFDNLKKEGNSDNLKIYFRPDNWEDIKLTKKREKIR